MNKLLLACLLGGSLSVCAQAPQLTMPLNVRQAYQKQTRDRSGLPGPRYWQNRARYAIALNLRPQERMLEGREEIMYINNSPDTLHELFFKLIQNIHRRGAARDDDAGDGFFNEGLVIDEFSIDGRAQPWEDNVMQHTIQHVPLAQPLNAHDSLRISFSWYYQVAREGTREGMIDSTTFFLAYFYPRVAVYDDYYGWDWLNFNNDNEFYNDFNDYVVRITVPERFIVWGTGTLVNPDEVLEPRCLARLKESYRSGSPVHIMTARELEEKRKAAGSGTRTWIWIADTIPDMTLGISDHFVWDAGSVTVDTSTGRSVSVQAVYSETAADFRDAAETSIYTVDWLSRQWPGLPYPYPKITVFQGYGDMEYPMMANVTSNTNAGLTKLFMQHEIAHAYFPFYMGINETKYPFMDEGWTTFFEYLICRSEWQPAEADQIFSDMRITNWAQDVFAEGNIPVITPANAIRSPAAETNAYGKPALAYLALRDLLGDTLFKACLHDYMKSWHGKHPMPWDFFYAFNRSCRENLDWFWSNWFFTAYNIDLALTGLASEKDGYSITIENRGGLYIPFDIELAFADGGHRTLHQTSACWKQGATTLKLHIPLYKLLASATLHTGIYVDPTEDNNTRSLPASPNARHK